MVCFRVPSPSPLLDDVLQICPSCQRGFCSRCAVRRGGRDFCGQRCGDTYFFAGEDEEEESEGE